MFALGAATAVGWVLWAGLLVILVLKLRYEEALWIRKFPAYADYMKQTKRLIPFVV